jgi:RNA polymerase sigma factor (sigma-70 family)
MDEVTDVGLVEAARRGEADAFGELVRRHQKQAFAVALSLIGDPAEAEDLTQEAFIRAARNLDLLVDPAKFGAWLRRITFGVCIDWLRTFRPELYRSSQANEENETALRSDALSPLERLQQMELSERVLGALAQLPARYRVPLTMYHIEGISHEKVAQALNAPVGTVRSLVSRARRKLAPILESYAKEVLSMSQSTEEVFQEQLQEPPRLLHLHNGDCACGVLEKSDVPGTNRVWADVLHEGPVPAGLAPDQFRDVRARFVASQGWETYERAMERYRSWDESLESFRMYDEVIMWFEHDLFDQLILIHHLDFFAQQNLGQTRLSLICIGEFPEVEPFHGLGQLNPDQLASLLSTRQQVTSQQLELGRSAWRAFTSSDPTELERLFHSDTSALPFLSGALQRFLEEYPSAQNGLPRTERQILSVLETGPKSPGDLFLAATYPFEERVFMGDSTFWARVKGLASGPHPLVEWDVIESKPIPKGEVLITDAGRAVLEGRADWIELDGVDRWLGGVRLQGREAAWRWDQQAARLRHGK